MRWRWKSRRMKRTWVFDEVALFWWTKMRLLLYLDYLHFPFGFSYLQWKVSLKLTLLLLASDATWPIIIFFPFGLLLPCWPRSSPSSFFGIQVWLYIDTHAVATQPALQCSCVVLVTSTLYSLHTWSLVSQASNKHIFVLLRTLTLGAVLLTSWACN